MTQRVRLGGIEYDASLLSDEGRMALARYRFATQGLQEAENMKALLTKAKNAYIAELKHELIAANSGLDLRTLFDE